MNKTLTRKDLNIEQAKKDLLSYQEQLKSCLSYNKYFEENNTMVGYPDLEDKKALAYDKDIKENLDEFPEGLPSPVWELERLRNRISKAKEKLKRLE